MCYNENIMYGDYHPVPIVQNKKFRLPFNEKAVRQLSKNDQFIAEYRSVTEAYRRTGIAAGMISVCCSGKTKSAGGFVWEFIEDHPNPPPYPPPPLNT